MSGNVRETRDSERRVLFKVVWNRYDIQYLKLGPFSWGSEP